MKQSVNSILKEVLKKVEPPEEELKVIKNSLREFLERFERKLKVFKINAEVFVGGSFAKNTVIKKDYYDVDVFVRFDKKYEDREISKLTAKILKEFANVFLIHGSRDYFRIKINPGFFIEVIPVIKIKNPKESRNITDLSYSHVRYIQRKIKSSKLSDEIKLAKVFCYANQCYGAESYINGFSGYALELLVYHYKSFLNFIRALSKIKDKICKIVIDIEKHYRNKQEVLMDMNSSKLQSPIILVDPTYKQRNALAALSEDTLKKFQKACIKFLKNPSVKAFEIKKTDLEKIKQNAKKKKFEFILLEAKTGKQEGDIAGSKLLKFYKHISDETGKFFEIKDTGFNYNGKKSARYFFVAKNKKEILSQGPNLKDRKNLARFRKKHRNTFAKNKKIYAKEKINFGIKKFIDDWKLKNRKKIKEMDIKELKIAKN